jgi:Flp pilus assembly protein TadD
MKKTVGIVLCGSLAIVLAGCRSDSTQTIKNDAQQPQAANDNPPIQPQSTSSSAPSGDVASLLAEGKRHFEDYRNDEAISAFKRVLELDSENGEAYYRLGLAYADVGNDEEADKALTEAVERFEKLVREKEDDITAQRYLALANSKLGKHDEAVRAYKQVVKLEPDESNNHYELGMELSRLAQYPEAVQAFKKATQLDPDDFRAVEALDRAQEGVKRRELALKKQEEELRRQDPANRSRSARTNTVPTLPVLTATPKQEN